MPSRSFKEGVGPPPLRYRTPSPPRYAFEPFSPTILGITPNVLNHRSRQNESIHIDNGNGWALEHNNDSQPIENSASALDTFTSIALASYSGQTAPRKLSKDGQYGQSASFGEDLRGGRPSKRVRNEDLLPSHSLLANSRRVSIQNSTFDEAELLLNFSMGARRAVPLYPSNRSSAPQGMHHSIPPQYHAQATAKQRMLNLDMAHDQNSSYIYKNSSDHVGGKRSRLSFSDKVLTSE